MEHASKEYYENQSEYWFNEASKFVKQRDILIDDNAKLRKERAKLQRKLDDVVSELNNFNCLHLTEIEQALKNKDLSECLFLLEKIKMDLEEDANND